MKALPTMQDIAFRANVSKMTVSRVLRNYPHISPGIQKRVLKLAKEMGYHLNPLLSHFSTHTKRDLYHGTIAWIDNHPQKNGSLRSKVFKLYFDGATDRAKELGYQVELIWLRQPGMSGRRLSKILVTRNIRGLLLAPQPNMGDQPYGGLKWDIEWGHFSIVNFGYSLPSPEFHMITHNQLQAMLIAVRKLRSLGYRRMACLIRDELNQRIEKQHIAGFLLEQRRLVKRDRVPPLILEEVKSEKLWPWFSRYRPEVIITNMVKKVFTQLQEKGVKIPREVGLVEIPGNPRDSDLSFTRVDQCSSDVGRQSVDLLLNLMSRNSTGIPNVRTITLIEGKWIEGQTTRSLVKRH
jgi:DNA-binding LacI/PurR family transcriptional regulator